MVKSIWTLDILISRNCSWIIVYRKFRMVSKHSTVLYMCRIIWPILSLKVVKRPTFKIRASTSVQLKAISLTASPCLSRKVPKSLFPGFKADWNSNVISFSLITWQTTLRSPVSKPKIVLINDNWLPRIFQVLPLGWK